MVVPTTAYARAIEEVFRILSGIVFPDKKPSQSVIAYLAGGSAIYLYTQSRVSKDVGVDFSARLLRPEVIVAYTNESGESKSIHLDLNYNGTLGLMHEGYDLRAESV